MSNRTTFFRSSRKAYFLVLLPILLYAVISCFIVTDYGMTTDEIGNFAIGEKYLYFYQTGHLDYQDDLPEIADHPYFYDAFAVRKEPYRIWPFANILSAVTCYIFFQRLRWLDPISAHHMIIPLLTAFFLYLLFVFVKRHWGAFTGFLSLGVLVTYPRFFGHTFNNIKDVPELIFFSAALILFAEWFLSKKIGYLYLGFAVWGLALATKMDAVFIAPILILWQLPMLCKAVRGGSSVSVRVLWHVVAGFMVTFVVVLALYPPILRLFIWSGGNNMSLAWEFITNIFIYVSRVGLDPKISWNLYAPLQIYSATPPVMIVLFIFGLVCAFRRVRADGTYLLLIIWVTLPIMRHCLPNANHYDGLRHFFVFVVPFAIIVSIGGRQILAGFSGLTKTVKILCSTCLVLLVLVPNLYALVSTHPYQTTYFNALVGGLKGAQAKKIPYSYDYWCNSYRKAAKWLEQNAKKDSYYFSYPEADLLRHHISRRDLKGVRYYEILPKYSYYFSSPEADLLRHHISRKDLKRVKYYDIFPDVPSNTYAVVIPKHDFRIYAFDKISSVTREMDVVHEIRSQGGEILTIYYQA